MRAVTVAEAKRNFENLVKRVMDDSEPAIVLTESGDQVVLMPLDDYNAWTETNKRNQANRSPHSVRIRNKSPRSASAID